MNLIQLIFGKDKVSYQDIEKLITNKKEEDRFLDYKSPEILNHSDLSKNISAFLNAEGGIIILGMREDLKRNEEKRFERKVYPKEVEPVSEEYTKERINQIIFSGIRSSTIPDIIVHPIRDERNQDKTVYIIEVLQGKNPPYQASDKKYYKRLNHICLPMEHYEIADYFGKRRRPDLFLTYEKEDFNIEGIKDPSFRLKFTLINKGKSVAKYTSILIYLPKTATINGGRGFKDVSSANNDEPILQFSAFNDVFHPVLPVRIGDIIFSIPEPTESFIQADIFADEMEPKRYKISMHIRGFMKQFGEIEEIKNPLYTE